MPFDSSDQQACLKQMILRTLFRKFPAAVKPLSRSPCKCPTIIAKMSTSTSPILSRPVKIALIQLLTSISKASNLERAREKVLEASNNGAQIVVLPECFNAPYGTEHFDKYAERIPNRQVRENFDEAAVQETYPTYTALRRMAIDSNTYLVAGSIPERSSNPPPKDIETSNPDEPQRARTREAASLAKKEYLYNTSLTFSPAGTLLGIHRKIHLFDIDIPGKITFTESSVLSPGSTPTLIDLPSYGKIGVQICYDIRFPELSAIYARNGAFAVIVPGAFNLTTGPLHWELLARGRANDNQVYVAMCSPARTPDDVSGYKAWGESMVCDPMGKVLSKAEGGREEIIYTEMIPGEIESARQGIPVTRQRRWDVYVDVAKGGKGVGDSLNLVD